MVFRLYSITLLFIFIVTGAFSPKAEASTIFEGWYKIILGDKHVGYIIHRYAYDDKKKEFRSTYYNVAKTGNRSVIESLDAKANDKFNPTSYQYTSKVNDQITTIDASFDGKSMTANVSDGKKQNSVSIKVPKGTFLSTFLGYLMLNKGIEVGKKFSFSAIAEEDGTAYSGEALVDSETKYKAHDVYKILVSFKGTKFISYMSKKGEVLGTRSPLQQISTELVANAADATKGFQVNANNLKKIFGGVPAGRNNVFSNKGEAVSLNPPKSATPAEPAKPVKALPPKDAK